MLGPRIMNHRPLKKEIGLRRQKYISRRSRPGPQASDSSSGYAQQTSRRLKALVVSVFQSLINCCVFTQYKAVDCRGSNRHLTLLLEYIAMIVCYLEGKNTSVSDKDRQNNKRSERCDCPVYIYMTSRAAGLRNLSIHSTDLGHNHALDDTILPPAVISTIRECAELKMGFPKTMEFFRRLYRDRSFDRTRLRNCYKSSIKTKTAKATKAKHSSSEEQSTTPPKKTEETSQHILSVITLRVLNKVILDQNEKETNCNANGTNINALRLQLE